MPSHGPQECRRAYTWPHSAHQKPRPPTHTRQTETPRHPLPMMSAIVSHVNSPPAHTGSHSALSTDLRRPSLQCAQGRQHCGGSSQPRLPHAPPSAKHPRNIATAGRAAPVRAGQPALQVTGKDTASPPPPQASKTPPPLLSPSPAPNPWEHQTCDVVCGGGEGGRRRGSAVHLVGGRVDGF